MMIIGLMVGSVFKIWPGLPVLTVSSVGLSVLMFSLGCAVVLVPFFKGWGVSS
jgi:uncharacterized membrane protein